MANHFASFAILQRSNAVAALVSEWNNGNKTLTKCGGSSGAKHYLQRPLRYGVMPELLGYGNNLVNGREFEYSTSKAQDTLFIYGLRL